MRFMIIVRATPDSEAGLMPEESLLASMATYHEALAKAGVLLDANGLKPSSKGWRVHYEGGQRTVVDGPFAETKELIAGYTMIQVRSREEAMQWALRFPEPFIGQPCDIEVRQLYELEDFAPSQAVERFRDIPGVSR
ncbi:YciI family protein [Achromobacter marplatensis]|uniref:YciI family protein n=1 Tax=Achromobacter marplatensis TaxID=470868 RepID=A0AA42W9D4_9BURK|nr:YciI family protein [Achromobacter marplatensis]MDH2049792.1 YciI family protein [Achromobacter marplatensis]